MRNIPSLIRFSQGRSSEEDRNFDLSPSLRVLLIICIAGLQALAVLTVVFFITLGTERALVRQSSELLQEAGARLTGEVISFLAPAQQAAELSARLVENGALDASNDAAIESHLFRLLQIAPQQSGLYFGRPDGSFVFVMRTNESGIYRTKIVKALDKGAQYIWRDESYSHLRDSFDPDDSYDPRTRPWYVSAKANRSTIWTKPYMFFTSQRPGVSTATPVFANGKLIGAFGVDIEIGTLNSMLASEQSGRGGASLILTTDGDVVAYSGKLDASKRTAFQTLDQLDDPIARDIFSPAISANGNRSPDVSFDASTGEIVAALVPISVADLPWQVGLYTSRSSFIGEIGDERRRWMWIALGVVMASAFIAYMLANRIGQRVAEFGHVAERDVEAELATLKLPRAPFRELADARETLAREIGQRRRFQAAYDRTFEVSSRGMARIDPEDGSFLHANARLTELLKHTTDWFLAHALKDLIRSEDAYHIATFRKTMQADQECYFEAQFCTQSGDRRWLKFTAILIRDETGAADHALAVFDDVEKERQARDDLERLRRDLGHVSRVNLMGEFAGGLAHELNQPLAAMVHDIDTARITLADDPPDTQELGIVLTDIESHAQRAGNIIRGLRNVMRKEKGRVKPFEVTELITQTLALLSAEAHDLDVDLTSDLGSPIHALGNRTQVAQIIVNLVRNSYEALVGTDAGRVTVKVHAADSVVEIEVADNGSGLLKGEKPFGKFESSKPSGLGLGLSICKSLAESNGGKIEYRPAKPHGAIFTITLEEAKG